jgi:hypothetical protein
VSSPSWYQFLTIAGALAVVNSVLVGGTLGLAAQAGTGRSRRRAPLGVIPAPVRWPDTSRGSERPDHI